MIALGSKAELQAFINAQELDELSGATVRVKGKIFYVALLGVYPSRLAAEQAAVARPASLQRYEPYIRSMASLQTAMAAVTDG
jgi:septal ring-binding cell division protein DamX